MKDTIKRTNNMIHKIKQLLGFKSQKQIDLLEFNRGFDWACGVLIRKEKTPFELEKSINDHPLSYDLYDKGVLEAVYMLTKGIQIKDNINYEELGVPNYQLK
jgi:hypothetical protein